MMPQVTVGVTSHDSFIRLQRFRLSLFVNSLHPELVLLLWCQTSCSERLLVGTNFTSSHPSSSIQVHLLNDIARKGSATTIFGFLPLELNVISPDFLGEERTAWSGGFVWMIPT